MGLHILFLQKLLMKMKKILLKNYKFTCRSCNKSKFKRVLSLGFQPLTNNLIKGIKIKKNISELIFVPIAAMFNFLFQ